MMLFTKLYGVLKFVNKKESLLIKKEYVMDEEILRYIKKWLNNNNFDSLNYIDSNKEYIQLHLKGWQIHYFFRDKDYLKNEVYLVSPNNRIIVKYRCDNLTITKTKRIHQIINKWIPRK